MLTKGDDYPIHQTPEPIAYTGAARNFYDRYFFNGYKLDEDIFFAAALGVYPYVNVMDGALSLIVDGVQHNLLASRAMHMERLDTQVGPIKVEVIEPLHQLRLIVDAPEHELALDAVFTSRALVQEEPRFTRRIGSQLVMDSTRLTQNGSWQGSLSFRGKEIPISPETWLGTRDRSWGVRNIGAPDSQPNPEAPNMFQFYWLWAPINWEDGVTLYHLNDDEHGRAWNTHGVWVPLRGLGDPVEMAKVSSDIEYNSGTRHAKVAKLRFETDDKRVAEITMKPRFHWYMKGVGYGHESFSHGSFHGELDTHFEEYPLADVDDAMNLHIQGISDVEMVGDLGERKGRGVLEQLIAGPHAPSGFTQQLDMAP